MRRESKTNRKRPNRTKKGLRKLSLSISHAFRSTKHQIENTIWVSHFSSCHYDRYDIRKCHKNKRVAKRDDRNTRTHNDISLMARFTFVLFAVLWFLLLWRMAKKSARIDLTTTTTRVDAKNYRRTKVKQKKSGVATSIERQFFPRRLFFWVSLALRSFSNARKINQRLKCASVNRLSIQRAIKIKLFFLLLCACRKIDDRFVAISRRMLNWFYELKWTEEKLFWNFRRKFRDSFSSSLSTLSSHFFHFVSADTENVKKDENKVLRWNQKTTTTHFIIRHRLCTARILWLGHKQGRKHRKKWNKPWITFRLFSILIICTFLFHSRRCENNANVLLRFHCFHFSWFVSATSWRPFIAVINYSGSN